MVAECQHILIMALPRRGPRRCLAVPAGLGLAVLLVFPALAPAFAPEAGRRRLGAGLRLASTLPPPVTPPPEEGEEEARRRRHLERTRDQQRRAVEYEEKLQKQWDNEWEDQDARTGIDWMFERLRRGMVGQSKYPKTVDELGGLPLFGKDGIPDQLGGIGWWRNRFVSAPPMSRYSDRGVPGSKTGSLDAFRILFNNLLQFLLGNESEDGAPVASWDPVEALEREGPAKFAYYLFTGNLQELAGGPLFMLLNKYFYTNGPVFKLAFGPRSFIVVSDPVIARHIITSPNMYDKGMLAEILEPIMGQGLIPADPEVWKQRRRVIVPGFHKRWLNRMITLFAECNSGLIASLYEASDASGGPAEQVDMEEKFCSVGLDIIGSAVFNYKFDSSTKESPVVKAVYRCLREAEHRSTAFIPYWTVPGLSGKYSLLEGQRTFARDLELLNGKLNDCIEKALENKDEADLEDLENRVYAADDDASLLRFLVDMKGEEASDKQLRDDLMTMLVAGHETTAALLTWTLFELARPENRHFMDKCRAEVDRVLGDRAVPTYDDIVDLDFTRMCLAEGLRLYPEPPVLIRRALDDDALPEGSAGFNALLPRGADVFVSTWNLHRSPDLWEEPLKYDPERWSRPFENSAVKGWKGFRPERLSGLYPDEQATDFAFLPFGGGSRKCVGDQFAMLEATVTLSLVLRRFDFDFVGSPDDVGLRTGATIHTENGLHMRVRQRDGVPKTGHEWQAPDHPILNPGGTRLKVLQELQAHTGGTAPVGSAEAAHSVHGASDKTNHNPEDPATTSSSTPGSSEEKCPFH